MIHYAHALVFKDDSRKLRTSDLGGQTPDIGLSMSSFSPPNSKPSCWIGMSLAPTERCNPGNLELPFAELRTTEQCSMWYICCVVDGVDWYTTILYCECSNGMDRGLVTYRIYTIEKSVYASIHLLSLSPVLNSSYSSNDCMYIQKGVNIDFSAISATSRLTLLESY